jgi:thiamine-monophosphate kinase
MSSEWARIDMLRGVFGGAADPAVLLGIGDDAAVLAPSQEPLVWTIDAAVEGVHFRRDLLSMEDIGYRATMAAVSDLGAMGAAPLGVLAALVLPPAFRDEELAALGEGQRAAVAALGTAVIGGNLARGGELSITTTALGRTPRPLTRAGARAGDGIWLAGPVGLAGAGLALLLGGATGAEERLSEAGRAAIAAWRRPRARIEAGLAARAVARCAIDVSDGLGQDVGHLARASGVRAILDAGALVSAELAAVAAELGRDGLDLALHGGEDYALVIGLPAGEALAGFRQIGWFEAPSEVSAVALRRGDGSVEAVIERGFDHFSARETQAEPSQASAEPS